MAEPKLRWKGMSQVLSYYAEEFGWVTIPFTYDKRREPTSFKTTLWRRTTPDETFKAVAKTRVQAVLDAYSGVQPDADSPRLRRTSEAGRGGDARD